MSTPDLSGSRYVLGNIAYTSASIVVILLKYTFDAPSV
jgi:hypothetical protein